MVPFTRSDRRLENLHSKIDTFKSPEPSPLQSLQLGTWFKLICGASYQDLPAVRNLALAYTLAGADCIDVAADLAVVAAAKEGIAAAAKIAGERSRPYQRPWLMVSVSAGEDPHFRKAWFDPAVCPKDCPRPCEKICPADAIDHAGVMSDRCYGCGRCLPICPWNLIEAKAYPTTLDNIARKVLSQADAIEIHTQVGQIEAFKQLWQRVQPWSAHLKLVSISCPDAEGLINYLKDLRRVIASHPSTEVSSKKAFNVIWQTDGRPMSGDIGKGTTRAAIRLAQKVLASDLAGYVQLAGGTNQHTAPKLQALGLLHTSLNNCPASQKNRQTGDRTVSGVAYGSYARHLLMPVIEQTLYLEEVSSPLWKAVAIAESLVKPLKQLSRMEHGDQRY
ncbi:MAG: LdpA C-terminal domain-containing domain [Phormidesmis sp.]